MKTINQDYLTKIIEAALFTAAKPLSADDIRQKLLVDYQVSKKQIISVLDKLKQDYQDRGIELVEVASGYRFQSVADCAQDLTHLFAEKAPKYSRALMETLALIAYKQPITRGEIEQIRGVSVTSHIIKSLLERNWVRISGHKEVPGRPAMYVTTPEFLDYFSLTSLNELPELMENIEQETEA